MRSPIILTIASAFLLGSGCSTQESSQADGETQPSVVEECDRSATHPKGAFEFAPQLDESLPEAWRVEFGVIMANLQEVAPISPCLHDFRDPETNEYSVKSPMSIYAWSSAIDNPWPEERPGMEGASVSGNGTDTWMVLEITQDDFKYDSLHRFSVMPHEYWHVYQRGAWEAQGLSWPIWMWEGGAKVVEELYIAEHYGRSDFDNNLRPVIATALSSPSDFELYQRDGGAVGGESDMNYTTSAFMVLALVKELQNTQGISEAQAFKLVLTAPAQRKSGTPFQNVFGMSAEDFYATLDQYRAVESGEDWFEGTVVDASSVMPSQDLTLAGILQSSD